MRYVKVALVWLGFTALWLLLASVCLGQSNPAWAVVRLKAYGCSGTIVGTTQGASYILTCSHAFSDGHWKTVPFEMDTYSPKPTGYPIKVGATLIKNRPDLDLALLRLNAGPLHYVAQVAPVGFKPGVCLSIGHDKMATQATIKYAHISHTSGPITYTKESPWHGRSGGGLFDQATGYLVGAVTGYTGSPKHQTGGIYVSHSAILQFLGMTAPKVQESPKVEEFRQPAPLYPYTPKLGFKPGCPPSG